MKKNGASFFMATYLMMLLTACGGGNVSLFVSEEGTTLIVDSGRYERRPEIYACDGGICVAPAVRPSYAAGQVLVFFDDARAQEGPALIARLGLTVLYVEDGSIPSMLVAVPVLFEEQWVQALNSQPIVRGAYTNNTYYIDPVHHQ